MPTQPVDRNPADASFAGLFSALAAAKSRASSSNAPSESWTDAIENDVATLTYERAMQNHSRYKGVETAATHLRGATNDSTAEIKTDSATSNGEPSGNRRRSASVTLRLSQAEFLQLQQRATEANLSISAYVRSCMFEVEGLRTQVKRALVEMRSSVDARSSVSSGLRWLRLLRRERSSAVSS